VLRVVDQRRGRAPDVCVKTGVPTDRAARARTASWAHAARWETAVGSTLAWLIGVALRRPATVVVVAVSTVAWRRWRQRLGIAVMVTTLGIGVIVIGVASAAPAGAVLGVLLAATGWCLRVRAARAWWVGLSFRADDGDVVVTRVHAAFAEEARQIYVDSIRRHPSSR
jgi:hypothetical protein